MLCKYRNTIQYIIQLNLYKVLHYRNIHIKYKKEGAHISHLPFLLSEKRSGTLRTQSLIFPVLSCRYENGVTDT